MWEEGVPPGVLWVEGETSRADTPYTGGSALSMAGCHPDPACSTLKEKICRIRGPESTSHRTLKIHCCRLWLSQENGSKKTGTRAVLEIAPPFSDDEIFAGT